MTATRLPRGPRISVNVTAGIIAKAVSHDSQYCMVAEAIKQQLPDVTHVSVDMQTVRFTDRVKKLRYTYLTPSSVAVKIVDFDQGKVIEPFQFRLEGAHVTRSGRTNPNYYKDKAKLTPEKVAKEVELTKALSKATLRRSPEKTEPSNLSDIRVGGKTLPLQKVTNTPFSRIRAYGLRALKH